MTPDQENKIAIDALAQKLKQYVAVSGKTAVDVLNQKGNDLRIQLYKEFAKYRWSKRRRSNIAWKEFRARVAAGKGTKIKWRTQMAANAPMTDKNGRPTSSYQRMIFSELEKRQRGIGFLAITFLLKRWNKKKSRLVRNYTATKSRAYGTLGEFILEEHPLMNQSQYEIRGFTDGLDMVANRHGILPRATAKVMADIDVYLQRKFNESLESHFMGKMANAA